MVTPYDESYNVDYGAIENLLKLQDEAKNGVLLLGSTGESLALNMEEKKEILKLALSLKLSVPIMVGVGGIHLPETMAWVEYLESLSVDAYLMVTPLYAKPGMLGQEQWFSSLMNNVTRPCMLYNIPGRTGCPLNPQVVKALSEHPRFWAVKEASGSINDFQNYRFAAPEISFYSGDDALMPHFAIAGSKGLVSVASNVWPKETNRYVQLCIKQTTQGIWPTWKIASDSLFTTSNPVPVKALLHHKQLIKTPFVRFPLSHLDLDSRAKLLTAEEMVATWWNHLVQ
ncbi:MAG: 4-hydroxy-tetrahydrodipicolinate synthase [Oligoflexia bacterium]|nr:4-hydroxy-tetrahydrodipicolinate synthase [Oligoflexia bacterium]